MIGQTHDSILLRAQYSLSPSSPSLTQSFASLSLSQIHRRDTEKPKYYNLTSYIIIILSSMTFYNAQAQGAFDPSFPQPSFRPPCFSSLASSLPLHPPHVLSPASASARGEENNTCTCCSLSAASSPGAESNKIYTFIHIYIYFIERKREINAGPEPGARSRRPAPTWPRRGSGCAGLAGSPCNAQYYICMERGYIYIYICMYVCMYIYIWREDKRQRGCIPARNICEILNSSTGVITFPFSHTSTIPPTSAVQVSSE
jgi:hypothetical protein